MNNEYNFSAAPRLARERVQDALSTARQRTSQAVSRGGEYVRERPAISVSSAFAAGLAVGILVVMAVRPTPKKSRLTDSRERLADALGHLAESLRGPLGKTYSSVSTGAAALSDTVSQAIEKVSAATPRSFWR